MAKTRPISPREEALKAIIAASATSDEPRLDQATWDRVLDIAWDNRTNDGDRREVQRTLRQVMLETARAAEVDDAVS